MSTIASFYVAPKTVLTHLTDAGVPAHEVLTERSRRIPEEFPWPGSVMMSLLYYLEERDIPIMSGTSGESERVFDGSVFAFGREHRWVVRHIDAMARDLPAVVRAISDDIDITDIDDPETAVQEGLMTLRTEINGLADDELFFLIID